MEKIWAAKDGYLANRDGNIYALNYNRTKTMRKVKQHTQTAGYLYFNKNGKPYLVHRFIAELFISNPNNLPEINHKNEDKTDNRVENLEWCDHKYNMNYGKLAKKASWLPKGGTPWNKGLIGINAKKVFQYTLYGDFVKEWKSASQIEQELGFSVGCIHACCSGFTKTSHGYMWSWEKKEITPHKTIVQYTLDGRFVAEYPSVKEAANALGLKNYGSIYHCLAGRLSKAYGHLWKANEK